MSDLQPQNFAGRMMEERMGKVMMLCDECACAMIRGFRAVPHYQDAASKHGAFGVKYETVPCEICKKVEACAFTTVRAKEGGK